MKLLKYLLFIVILNIPYAILSQDNAAKSQPGSLHMINIEDIQPNNVVKQYVEQKIAEWQQKGEFEKTSEYKKRVSEENRKQKIREFEKEVLSILKEEYIKTLDWNNLELREYDADNETYLVKSPRFGEIILPVDIETAPEFKKHWDQVKVKNPELIVKENDFQLAEVTFHNTHNNKKYVYNSQHSTSYSQKEIDYNFADINYQSELSRKESESESKITKDSINLGKAEIDVDIPKTNLNKPNTYALIIGNENYTKYQNNLSAESNVDFASNDARIFKKYCTNTLGIPENNIKFRTDVISSQMKRDIKWLISRAEYGGSDVKLIFYYAGHGFPHPETKEKYIVPVDITGSDIENGIKLSKLYKDLTQHPSEQVTVFMDACFSGGGRDNGLLAARVIKAEPQENAIMKGNLVAFSASSGDQESLYFREKQHGIFTYYLLKKLRETKGNVSYGELQEYLKQKVPMKSVDLYSNKQEPEVNTSYDIEDDWKNWKLR